MSETEQNQQKPKDGAFGSRSIAQTGLFTALIMLLTLAAVPLPGGGIIHPGDAAIFAACIIIGWRAIPAAAAGSALADVIMPNAIGFAPGTFVIKGIMAAIAVLITGKSKRAWVQISAFIVASVWMQGAYVLYQFLFATTLLNAEAFGFMLTAFLLGWIQSIVGVPLGFWLARVLKKIRIEYGTEKKEP